ncbi:hypothetical protein N7523_004174 [Penicillium sp. IBT 18751x]|nr:hypothetical protein N7523_004174 [Penicillium sp. IBT 18751x]
MFSETDFSGTSSNPSRPCPLNSPAEYVFMGMTLDNSARVPDARRSEGITTVRLSDRTFISNQFILSQFFVR